MAKKKLNCKTIRKANKKWVACFPEKGTKAKPKAKPTAKTVKKKAVIKKPKAKPVKKKANIDASAGGRVLLGGGGNVMKLIGSFFTEGAGDIKMKQAKMTPNKRRADIFFRASRKNRKAGQKLLEVVKTRKGKSALYEQTAKEVKAWLADRAVINKMYKRDKQYVKDTNGIKWRTALGKRLKIWLEEVKTQTKMG